MGIPGRYLLPPAQLGSSFVKSAWPCGSLTRPMATHFWKFALTVLVMFIVTVVTGSVPLASPDHPLKV